MAFTYSLKDMLRKFGLVTVMDVEFFEAKRFEANSEDGKDHIGDWDAKSTLKQAPLFTLDTLKISNINQEGPTKTITGGMNADKLLKYGKTYTIEMQDALGRLDVLTNIYGANYSGVAGDMGDETVEGQILAFSDRFPGELTLVGKTYVIDQKSGAKQPIKIVIPLFLSDGIFNLTMDAEGDATVFDLNGDILSFDSGNYGEKSLAADGKLYARGGDNLFYFFITEEGYGNLKAEGFEAAWIATSAQKVIA